MNTYSQKIQRAIKAATRQRGKLNDLYEQIETHYEGGIAGVTDASAHEYVMLREDERQQRQNLDHLHMLIGQWLVDEITGGKYGD